MKNIYTKAKIKECLNYVGLWVEKNNSYPFSYDIKEYITTDEKKVLVHRELLKSIEKNEDARLGIIETKTSQIITFTGIIFSALSLFIPALLDRISEQNIIAKILSIFILILTFIFYVLTILNAIRNYNIKKFIYSRSHPNNVIKYQDKTVAEFRSIEIQDLLHVINQNIKSNNAKANNLMYAYGAFRNANILTGILGIVLCFSLLFTNQKETSITVKNPIQIQKLDSATNAIIKTIKEQDHQNKQFGKCCHDTISGKQ